MTYIHKVKCMACQLHFAVYSWREDWGSGNNEDRAEVACPECGQTGWESKMHAVEQTDDPIFQLVPGHTNWVGVGAR